MTEDDGNSGDGESETSYPNVDVTITFVDDDGDPVEGLRVSLEGSFGFYDDEVTDSDGEVVFKVSSWQTYPVWVEGSQFDEVGVEGSNSSFSFTWDA